MADGGNNIDNLSFGIILKDEDFKKKMGEVKTMAEKFSKDVEKALDLTKALNKAQGASAKETKKDADATAQKARKQKEIVTLTRQELEAKKAAGTATKAELQQLNAILRSDKLLLDEEKKRVQLQKEQVRLKRQENLLNNGTSKDIQLTSNQLLQQSGIMKGLTSMASQYFSVFGAAAVVRNLVRITGEFEAQHTALRAILQDTAAADNIYNQLQVLAVKSPYTFQNLVGYAKQLTAFSIPVNEVYETTKKLADVSAGLGVDMGRIILAYGQVRSAEFLRGQEVRQFTEAGIPILKELADQIQEMEGHAVSVGEVFDRISARQIPFAMVEEAFNRMTSAGGKFYNMQEVLAETVKGKVSNLQDAWEIMLSKIGDENSGTIKGIVNGLTNLFANYEKWIGLLGTVIKYIGIYGAGLAVLNGITKTYNGLQILRNGFMLIGNQQVKLSTILLPTNIALQKLSIKNTKKEAEALASLNLARKAAMGVLAALAAIILSVIQHSIRSREEARKTTDTINAALSKLSVTMADFKIGTDKVDAAFVKMKDAEGDATEETKKFNNAVDDLKKQFPKFIDDNVKLAESVDELGQYWARARMEMNQYFADEARDNAQSDLQSNRKEQIDALEKEFTKYIQSLVPKKEWSVVGKTLSLQTWRYVLGEIDREGVNDYVSSLSGLFGQKQGTSINYANSILDELDGFATRYKGIMDNYTQALDDIEARLREHNLSTTRKTINDYLATITSDESLLIGNDQSIEAFADALRERYASPATSEAIKTAIKTLFDQFPKVLGEVSNELTGWRKKVNDIITGFNSGTDAITGIREVKLEDQRGEVIDGWKKELEDTKAALAKIPSEYATIEDYEYKTLTARQSLLESLSMALYGNKTFSGASKPPRNVVDDLKQEYQNLKELKTAYDKFKSIGFEDEQINGILNNFFGVGIPEGGFNAAFESLASRMDKYSKNDARDIRNYAAGKDWKAFYASEKARLDAEAKALEDYNKRIGGYIEEAKDIQQKIDDLEEKRKVDLAGATTDEQKKGINFHYDTEIDKLKESLIELTSIQLTDFWQQLTGEKNGTYGSLTKLQRKAEELIETLKGIEPNRNKDGKITGYTLTQDNAGDFLKSLGVDAESLQLSVAQVEALNKAFDSLFGKRAEKNGIATLIDAISKGGVFKNFWKDVKEGSGPAITILQKASAELSKIGGIFKDLGGATGSGTLSSLGETLSFVGDFAGKIASKDYIGAISSVVSAFTSWISESRKLKEAIAEAADEAERLAVQSRLANGVDTVFGENTAAKAKNAIELMKEYKKLVDADKSNGGIEWRSGLFHWGRSSKSLASAVSELGYELYDVYGNLNSVALQAILDTYENLDSADREWITNAIKNSELYAQAAEQLNGVVGDIFGGVADDLTNTFIDNFLEMGNAVDDLGDSFTNLGDTILRSMLKSFILDEILNKYEDEVRAITNDALNGEASADAVALRLGDLADNVGKDIKASGNFIQQMIQAFYDRGLLNGDTTESSNNLSNGIKAITEDTANLLASYLNAIRADVSYGKTQWERIAAAVEGQNTRYITLNDYMMQVQANTANIARSNEKILNHIESVLTSEGGFMAIRTYS